MGEAVLVGLLFADHILEEKSGKKSIIGTFTTIYSEKFPFQYARFGIYAAVTNLEGEHEFALNLVNDETQQVVIALSGKIASKSRLEVIEIVAIFEMVLFPKPGKYNLTYVIDGYQVGSRVLPVQQIPKQPD